jgi:ribose transport system permease protein
MTALLKGLPAKPWIWSFVGAALVFIASLVFTRGFGAAGIVVAGLSLASFAVVVGMGQMFVMSLGPGNVDLSLPANIGLASAIAMKVMSGSDSMIVAGVGAALIAGVLIGLANYALIRALRIPPIIATLSTSFIVQSIDISYGRGLQVKPPPGFAAFTDWRLVGIPVFVLLILFASIIAAVALNRTVYGRSVLAIGQNMRAAWLAGIKVERIRVMTYMLCGALGGLSGALLAAYFRGSSTDIGNEYLLASIAVVVIGGTSVAGGRANVPGLWGAALFLVLLQVMLNTFGADASVRLVTTGLVIIAVITAAGGAKALR